MRRRVVSLLALLLATSAPLLGAGCNRVETRPVLPTPSAAADSPNVLLVTIDTLRADRVGVHGGPDAIATPAIDALAADGTYFEAAMAPTPLTLPSHTSILTGQNPPRHGVRHNGLYRLAAEVPTLAARLRDAGFETGAVVAAVVLAPAYGLDQGFDHYDADVSSERAGLTGFHERKAEDVTEAALAWLGRRDGDRPFFLWVHFYDPHAVYDPPLPYAERHRGDAYAGEIAYTDAQLARLLEALRVSGELDRTLVAVTSDHGESLGEHGEMTHAYTTYDASLHVPLVLRGPGIPVGRRIASVVSTVDVAPTLLARLRLPALPAADGRDLTGLWADEAAEPASAYAESLATQLDHGWAPLHALRTERHLYVRAPRPELYDVREDPGQLRNLLEADPTGHAGLVQALETELEAVLANEGEAGRVELDAATRSQLQALGYAIAESPVASTGVDPKDGIRWITPFEHAKANYHEGRFAEAEAAAIELLGEFDSSPGVHDLLGRVYLTVGRLERARHHAEIALQLLPRSPHQHHLLGLVQIADGDEAGAVASFERSLAVDPTFANAAAGLMWRLENGGTLADADAASRAAVGLHPQSAELRVLIADTWDQLGHYDRALASYREALELDPRSGAAHLGLAVQTARMGDVGQIEGHLSRAGPTGFAPGSRMRVAIALAGRGESARAEAMLRGLLHEDPDFSGARRVLARLLENTGRADEASTLR